MSSVLTAGCVCEERLPDAAGGKRRGVRWTPAGPDAAAADGELVVMAEGRGLRRYAVTEVLEPHDRGRLFLVRPIGKAVPYEVVCSHRGESDDSCTCESRLPCCHRLGVRAVVESGWLPDPFDSPLMGGLPTADEVEAMARELGWVGGDPFKGG